jgi:CheY-like chemotaxis protein
VASSSASPSAWWTSTRPRATNSGARGERLESLGRLAGGIAHDFNNLLAVIIGHASALSDSGLTGEASEDAAEIVSAGKRAAVLTRQLLQFARREQVEPRVVDLAEQTRALLPLLERLAGESIKLVVEEQGGPLTLSMPPGHLEQVLLNVVANARDAMPEGGHIWLRLRSEELGPAAAKEREVAPGPMVVLEVEDDGTGMPPELLERIFEPFFSTKPAGKGTGLGLATTDGIIRQAHGAITVTSAVAQGTTFRFYFPRSDGPVDDTEPPPVLTPSGGHETILLVEDECSLRALAARVLRKAGYRVLEAERGDTALAVARAHAEGIDLLISDVVLPGGSGPSVAEALRRDRPKLKVLLVSGYSDVPLASVPDSAFLAKPYTPAQLLDLARTTLGRGGT